MASFAISVMYGVKIDVDLSEYSYAVMANRLRTFDMAKQSTLQAAAGRAVPDQELKNDNKKRKLLPDDVVENIRLSKGVLVKFSDTHLMTDQEKELMNEELAEGNVWGCLENIARRWFPRVLDEILGDGHGLKLIFFHGGYNFGEYVDPGLAREMFFLEQTATEVTGSRGRNFDGRTDAPWGCDAVPIPTDKDMTSTKAAIQKVIETLNLSDIVSSGPGWQLITEASGGF